MKLLKINAVVILFISIISLIGCRKDKGGSGGPGPGQDNPRGQSPVTATVTVLVLNENDKPVSGAIVRAETKSATTDSKGMFRFNSITLDKYTSLVTAEQNGYFKAYRVFPAKENGVHFVKIKLLPKTQAGSFNASSGGIINLPDNSQLSLDASSLVNQSTGQSYTGSVNVLATSIDPTSNDIASRIPGSFTGINKSNQTVTLRSFGMMAIELQGQNGEVLQIANGKKANIKFTIPASLNAQAPSSIPLWYVDESTGIWKEEGVATKSGNSFSGQVGHFSFWNADIADTVIFLKMTLHTQSGAPLPNTLVEISRLEMINGIASDYTDSTGYVGGLVPRNRPLKMEVKNACNEVVYQQNIGPFDKDTDLGIITISTPASEAVRFSGSVVNCSNQPVTNGFVEVFYENLEYNTPINNGQFSLTMTRCSANSGDASLFARDNATGQVSQGRSYPVNSTDINVGTISACDTVTYEYLAMVIDTSILVFDSEATDTLNCFSQAGVITVFGAKRSNLSNSASFTFQASDTGTVPLLSVTRSGVPLNLVPPSNVFLTNYAASTGQYMGGTFYTLYNDAVQAQHVITCVFYLKRRL